MCFIFKAPLSQLWSLTVLICHLFLCLAGRIYLLHSLIAVAWHSGWAGEPALCSGKLGGSQPGPLWAHFPLFCPGCCDFTALHTRLICLKTAQVSLKVHSVDRYSVIPGILCSSVCIFVCPKNLSFPKREIIPPGVIKYGTRSVYGMLNQAGFFSLEKGWL